MAYRYMVNMFCKGPLDPCTWSHCQYVLNDVDLERGIISDSGHSESHVVHQIHHNGYTHLLGLSIHPARHHQQWWVDSGRHLNFPALACALASQSQAVLLQKHELCFGATLSLSPANMGARAPAL